MATVVGHWKKTYLFAHGDVRHKIEKNPYNQLLNKVLGYCQKGDFQSAYCFAATPEMRLLVDEIREQLCNEYGILKRYEHLSAWQNLSYEDKRRVGTNLGLQRLVNATLRIENALPGDLVSLASQTPQHKNYPKYDKQQPSQTPDPQKPSIKEKIKKALVTVLSSTVLTEEQIKELEMVVEAVKARYPQLKDIVIRIDFRHLFEVATKVGRKGPKVHGFHLDYLNEFEKGGLVEITDKVAGKNGCYGGMVRVGDVVDPKTFFNPQWIRREVVTKVVETIANGFSELIETTRNFRLESYANDGTPIRVIYRMAEKVIDVTTSYPGLKDWKK